MHIIHGQKRLIISNDTLDIVEDFYTRERHTIPFAALMALCCLGTALRHMNKSPLPLNTFRFCETRIL